MFRISRSLPALLCLLAACGGGGGATTAAGSTGAGAVHVVLDPATGSDALVQFQLSAAVFERADGSTTGNVLPAADLVTLSDPTGESTGIVLENVPSGAYTRLHLLLAPGSGEALYPDGHREAVAATADLVVPITAGLQHSSSSRSWLSVGHDGTPPPAAHAASRHWGLSLGGRDDGSDHRLSGLRIASVGTSRVVATAPIVGDAALSVSFSDDCAFDDHGGRGEFLRGSSRGDDLEVDGSLRRDGTFVATRARRGRHGDDGPRLIGRVGELFPATSAFTMHVLAEVQNGGPRFGATLADVLVDASTAVIHASDDRRVLQFADLQLDQLVKVKWSTRTPRVGETDLVVAREVEVSTGVAPMRPEWHGAVSAVDLPSATLTVVRHHDDLLVVQGQSVTSIAVHVGAGVSIVRKGRHGAPDTIVPLAEVVPGVDEIWVRGAVTGPTAVEADRVRVRDDG